MMVGRTTSFVLEVGVMRKPASRRKGWLHLMRKLRQSLAGLVHRPHTLGANPDLLWLPLGIQHRRLLQVGTPHTVGAALGEADVVAERRGFAAHGTLGHFGSTPDGIAINAEFFAYLREYTIPYRLWQTLKMV